MSIRFDSPTTGFLIRYGGLMYHLVDICVFHKVWSLVNYFQLLQYFQGLQYRVQCEWFVPAPSTNTNAFWKNLFFCLENFYYSITYLRTFKFVHITLFMFPISKITLCSRKLRWHVLLALRESLGSFTGHSALHT